MGNCFLLSCPAFFSTLYFHSRVKIQSLALSGLKVELVQGFYSIKRKRNHLRWDFGKGKTSVELTKSPCDNERLVLRSPKDKCWAYYITSTTMYNKKTFSNGWQRNCKTFKNLLFTVNKIYSREIITFFVCRWPK